MIGTYRTKVPTVPTTYGYLCNAVYLCSEGTVGTGTVP